MVEVLTNTSTVADVKNSDQARMLRVVGSNRLCGNALRTTRAQFHASHNCLRRSFADRDQRSQQPREFARLFVSNVPVDTPWQAVKDHFAKSGGKYVSLSQDWATGKMNGNALVSYDSLQEATEAAATLNNSELNGSVIQVRLDRKVNYDRVMESNNPADPRRALLDQKRDDDHRVDTFGIKKKYANSQGGFEGKSLRKLIREDRMRYTDEASGSFANDEQLDLAPRSASWEPQTSRKFTVSASDADRDTVNAMDSNQYYGYSDQRLGNNETTSRQHVPLSGTPYKRAESDEVYTMLQSTLDEIQSLVDKRAWHRDREEFREADALQQLLRQKHHVLCDDLLRTWSVGFHDTSSQYTKVTPLGKPVKQPQLPSSTLTFLDKLLSSHQPASAVPSAGSTSITQGPAGAVESERPKTQSSSRAAQYQRDPEDRTHLTPYALAQITQLLEERAYARSVKDYIRANEAHRFLISRYRVNINDQTLLWRIDDKSRKVAPLPGGVRLSGPGRVSSGMDDENDYDEYGGADEESGGSQYQRSLRDAKMRAQTEVATIEVLVAQRARYLEVGNREKAAQLTRDLLEKYGVTCDGNSQRWRRGDPRPYDEDVDGLGHGQGDDHQHVEEPRKESGGRQPSRRYEGRVIDRTEHQDQQSPPSSEAVPRQERLARATSEQPDCPYQRDKKDVFYLPRGEVAAVQELVAERVGYLTSGDRREADRVAEQLRQQFNVVCDDTAQLWSVVPFSHFGAATRKGKRSTRRERAEAAAAWDRPMSQPVDEPMNLPMNQPINQSMKRPLDEPVAARRADREARETTSRAFVEDHGVPSTPPPTIAADSKPAASEPEALAVTEESNMAAIFSNVSSLLDAPSARSDAPVQDTLGKATRSKNKAVAQQKEAAEDSFALYHVETVENTKAVASPEVPLGLEDRKAAAKAKKAEKRKKQQAREKVPLTPDMVTEVTALVDQLGALSSPTSQAGKMLALQLYNTYGLLYDEAQKVVAEARAGRSAPGGTE